jgi:predicted nucleic acid-binding protein
MFDTNIFDAILDDRIEISQLPKKVDYFVTHIQLDEIEAINKPEKMERKKQLLKLFKEIKKEEVATESFVFDVSRLDKAKLSDGTLLEELRKGNLKNTEDALIGETAIKNNLILVTNENKFLKKVKALGGQAINFKQFLESCG